MSTFSPIAQTSFANSTAYDAHRPTYPQASVQHLLEQCRVAGKRGNDARRKNAVLLVYTVDLELADGLFAPGYVLHDPDPTRERGRVLMCDSTQLEAVLKAASSTPRS